MMKKKYYIAPDIRTLACESEEMIASSVFNTEDAEQSITFSDETTNEFTSRRIDLWEDEQ